MMNQKQVKDKLKQTREALNAKQYHDAIKLCQVVWCLLSAFLTTATEITFFDVDLLINRPTAVVVHLMGFTSTKEVM